MSHALVHVVKTKPALKVDIDFIKLRFKLRAIHKLGILQWHYILYYTLRSARPHQYLLVARSVKQSVPNELPLRLLRSILGFPGSGNDLGPLCSLPVSQ